MNVINILLELFVSRPDVLTYISIFIPVGEYYSCNLYLTRTTCEETRCSRTHMYFYTCR